MISFCLQSFRFLLPGYILRGWNTKNLSRSLKYKLINLWRTVTQSTIWSNWKPKEEDGRTVLREGDLIKSASLKRPATSIKATLIRLVNQFSGFHFLVPCFIFHCSPYILHLFMCIFVTMEDLFLLENRPESNVRIWRNFVLFLHQ